jgi:MFS family permease
METDAADNPSGRQSAWGPLRQHLFRSLWIAAVVSNVGTWVEDVGEAWLMTSLTKSPILISLLQTAESLPIFLLALPAGAFADIMDRRRLLIFAQIWMLVVAAWLGVMTIAGATTPFTLLLLAFLLGLGVALNAPAWQAIIPELVIRSEVPAALALNGIAVNIARAVGPAIGGLIVASAGPGAAFLFNASSFLAIAVVIYRWHRPTHKSVLPAERAMGAIRAGTRYVRHSPAFRIVLMRLAAFIIFGSAIWALFPVLARFELKLGPTGYGLLFGSLGAGAITAAAVLPALRKKASLDLLVAEATVLFALMLLLLAFFRHPGIIAFAMFAVGAAWLTLLSSFITSAQGSVPSWVRGRALAFYMLVFFGGMGLGSTLWGTVAEHFGVTAAFVCSAVGLVAGFLITAQHRLKEAEGLDLEQSLHWAAPRVVREPRAEEGPVLVTVEYRIDPAKEQDFADAMGDMKKIRRRDGAIRWGLYRDTSDQSRHVETFVVESWVEHLRQHERVTMSDRPVQERVNAFHIGPEKPTVRHLIYVSSKSPRRIRQGHPDR